MYVQLNVRATFAPLARHLRRVSGPNNAGRSRQCDCELVDLCEQRIRLAFDVEYADVESVGRVPDHVSSRVLLYDGEELLGAKQNRILNITVLVAARSTTSIPVSCVEEGRWSRRSANFAAAPHAAHPELRRRKAQMLSAEPLARGVAQSEVWEEVRAKSARMNVHSPTGAQADVFRSREDELHALEQAFPLQPGQCGALFAVDGELCLDYVSRPEAFSRLYPKLRAGYLLDALERLDAKPANGNTLNGFVASIATATRARQRSVGLGEDLRLRGERVVGSGLELERRAAPTLRLHRRRTQRTDRQAESAPLSEDQQVTVSGAEQRLAPDRPELFGCL